MTVRNKKNIAVSLADTTISGRVSSRLFSGLLGRGLNEDIGVPMAVMIPLVTAMLADGYVDDREIEQIHSICRSSPIFERDSEGEIEHLITRATRILEQDGLTAAFGKVTQTLSIHLRETAFVHAVRVIFSDSYVDDAEKNLLEQMIGLLAIDPERARIMIEVVSIMQHPASI